MHPNKLCVSFDVLNLAITGINVHFHRTKSEPTTLNDIWDQ